MHDQKKKETEVLSDAQKAAAAAEHERVGVYYTSILHACKTRVCDAKVLEDSEALLVAVPEAYTAYNCRRRALEAVWASSTNASPEARREALRAELKLNSKVLLMNYKNYNAFVHRHWIFDQLESLAQAELRAEAAERQGDASAAPSTYQLLRQLLQKERAQCEQLLQLDERNFHAWNYRRWVLAQELRATALYDSCAAPAQHLESAAASSDGSPRDASTSFTAEEAAELAYTTQKIKNNFSNYSAWHQRSLAVKSAVARWTALAAREGGAAETAAAARHATLLAQLREDVEFLKQAVYCDPNDQSAWFYAPFVLQLLRETPVTTAEAAEEAAALADAFVDAVVELVADVDRVGSGDECYLPYFFLFDQLLTLEARRDDKSGQAAVSRYTTALCSQVPALALAAAENTDRSARCYRYLYERLCVADAARVGLYRDMLKRAEGSSA